MMPLELSVSDATILSIAYGHHRVVNYIPREHLELEKLEKHHSLPSSYDNRNMFIVQGTY
jgi:hypothetical protein